MPEPLPASGRKQLCNAMGLAIESERGPSCRRCYRLSAPGVQCTEQAGVWRALLFGTTLAHLPGNKRYVEDFDYRRRDQAPTVLEGNLVAPWTDELKAVCQGTFKGLDHRELVIDVRGLTVISTDGDLKLCRDSNDHRVRGVIASRRDRATSIH